MGGKITTFTYGHKISIKFGDEGIKRRKIAQKYSIMKAGQRSLIKRQIHLPNTVF